MLTLGLDTASQGCGVALWRDGRVLALRQEAMARGQDTRLLPLVQDVMGDAGLELQALDRIAVLRGPGSFTGLRIGLAAARGLGLALDKPVLGIDRLWLHHAVWGDGAGHAVLVILDSRREEFFCRYFPARHAPVPDVAAPFLATADALAVYDRADVALCGDGAACRAWRQAKIMALPQAEAVCAAQISAMLNPADHPPLPLYLRAPDVSCGPAPATEEAAW